jgi:hypothetical protein
MPFTITTTSDSFDVDGTRWRRDDDGNLFVYDTDDTSADPVAEVDADEFVGIYRH